MRSGPTAAVESSGTLWTRQVEGVALPRAVLGATGALWTALVLFLALYNLEGYPTIWFDEGSHLHVPKVLVQHRVYADLSSDGFRYFGPTTGVGPTVMLPVAALFQISGVGLLQARLVVVAYLVAAVLLLTLAVRRLYDWPTALLASAILVSSPALNLFYLGRQVLGEVPALAFLLAGVLLWWDSASRDRRGLPRLALASLSLGLAAATKSQIALLLGPALVLLMVADRLYYRQLTLRYYLFPLIAVGAGTALLYLVALLPLLGTEELHRVVDLWRQASSGAIFTFSPRRLLGSIRFLFSPDVFAHWGLPALAYGLVLARERSLAGLRQGLLVAVAGVGLAWYSLGSIGWARYAFPSLALLTAFAARLLLDVARSSGYGPMGGVRRAAVLTIAGLMVLSPLQQQTRQVLAAPDRSPQLVAAYLKERVPLTAVVETWEAELGFLTDHRYHYPPPEWLARAVRAKWLENDAPLTGYDPSPAGPSYLVVGPFAKYTDIYSPLLDRAAMQPEVSFGQYDVYRLR